MTALASGISTLRRRHPALAGEPPSLANVSCFGAPAHLRLHKCSRTRRDVTWVLMNRLEMLEVTLETMDGAMSKEQSPTSSDDEQV